MGKRRTGTAGLKSRSSGYCLRKMKRERKIKNGAKHARKKMNEGKKKYQQQQHQIDKGKCIYNGIGTIWYFQACCCSYTNVVVVLMKTTQEIIKHEFRRRRKWRKNEQGKCDPIRSINERKIIFSSFKSILLNENTAERRKYHIESQCLFKFVLEDFSAFCTDFLIEYERT